MRRDSIGFFWNDAPVPKPPKPPPVKRTPPERTWERPDYLPGLEEALRFPVLPLDDYALATELGGQLLFDIEVYPNYFEIGFMSLKTGRVITFEMDEEEDLDMARLRWIVENFTLIGFNSKHFDLPLLSFALAGHTNQTLYQITEAIIVYEENASDILRSWKVKRLQCDHIDLIEVPRIRASLKSYAGRIHAPKLQDLPFKPGTVLSREQKAIVRWYNVNDMVSTGCLFYTLQEQLELRYLLTKEHGIDLRSKSDAQIAEAVIAKQIQTMTGTRPQKPVIPIGTTYYYKAPAYLTFRTPQMQQAFEMIKRTPFVVGAAGTIETPPELKDFTVTIGRGVYRLGIGGLHSSEKSTCHRAVGDYKIFDRDVESFYPRMILNQGLYPEHLGPIFLQVFNEIVERRIAAKRAGDKAVANSLKITINGNYGKLGSPWSIFYAPHLLIQTTITGQLSLLMLIELLELYGIEVISANTDGIGIKVHASQMETYNAVVKYWEVVCNFKTEETEYLLLASKDVNNYIAVKTDGTTKTKGEYFNPWADSKNVAERLTKNPAAQISIEAVEAYLIKQIPVDDTIYQCRDFTKFVSVRRVKKGAVKNQEYLGESIRWYYSTEESGEIIYAESGNVVPRSERAKPQMTMRHEMPSDIDHAWYIARANRILKDIGVLA